VGAEHVAARRTTLQGSERGSAAAGLSGSEVVGGSESGLGASQAAAYTAKRQKRMNTNGGESNNGRDHGAASQGRRPESGPAHGRLSSSKSETVPHHNGYTTTISVPPSQRLHHHHIGCHCGERGKRGGKRGCAGQIQRGSWAGALHAWRK